MNLGPSESAFPLLPRLGPPRPSPSSAQALTPTQPPPSFAQASSSLTSPPFLTIATPTSSIMELPHPIRHSNRGAKLFPYCGPLRHPSSWINPTSHGIVGPFPHPSLHLVEADGLFFNIPLASPPRLPQHPAILKTMILLCLDHVPQYTRMDGPRSRIEGGREMTISIQVSIV
ncbi:hypothetical protein AMTR_s00556p00002860 [Amborella trichopoda]|uniref:Uncharacterized protein n=1 Tax=Amborella trichopoda TaxID=13333 RepID=W1PW77_AMBTC|nr:hypothetical protein AMTR_s00556p00002860 [Amborella trichopoda]